MTGKVDLVMWTKNGAETLPIVLKRIGEVIPDEFINNRLIIDDYSIDDTCEIAKSFGWQIIFNKGKGISDGANTALKYVNTERFISVEQDLLLAKDWWINVPPMLEKDKVAVASGVRVPDKPFALKKLQEYTTEVYRLKTQKNASFFYGKTLDNTIYKTAIIKQVGGFPKLRVNAGVDNVLAKKLHDNGYIWEVNFNVKSIHLRQGLMDELKHYYWYGTCRRELSQQLDERGDKLINVLLRTGFSPIRGLQVAYKQKCWQIAYIYPMIRLAAFLGILKEYVRGSVHG